MTPLITPADWLLAEYDTTDPGELIQDPEPALARPIFTLKSVMDPGYPMRVAPADYHDPDRWWL